MLGTYNLKHLQPQNSLLFICSPSRLVLHDYYVVGKRRSGHLEVIERSPRNGVHGKASVHFSKPGFIFRRAWSAYNRVSSSMCRIFCRLSLQITFEKTPKTPVKALPNEVSNGR